jgi:hypothetical protein
LPNRQIKPPYRGLQAILRFWWPQNLNTIENRNHEGYWDILVDHGYCLLYIHYFFTTSQDDLTLEEQFFAVCWS